MLDWCWLPDVFSDTIGASGFTSGACPGVSVASGFTFGVSSDTSGFSSGLTSGVSPGTFGS